MFFKTYGILGQNARNLNYIKGHNNAIARKLADSKLQTKDFLSKKGVSVPATLFILKKHEELSYDIFEKLIPPFVVKPNNGFGGKGIIVFDSKDQLGNYVSNTGKTYSKNYLLKHFGNILDGFYSISGLRDKVIIEKKVILDHEIELLGKYGLPDIRIIVFNMVPVMAMLRVPTKESGGKANLHAGACGVGIDLGTGKLTYITRHSKIIKSIPDIGDIRGIKIPKWEEILTIAVKVQQKTEIGYLGCDIVLDEKDGPLLLEMNIRAGLEVQVANMAPLKERLEKVGGVNINSVEKGVRLGRDLFSGDIEEKIKNISGKKVLGLREYLTLIYNEKKYKYLAEVKISQQTSFIDREFAKNILKVDNDKLESGQIRVEGRLMGENRRIKFIIKDLENINIILGINSLKGYLVDPFKYRKGEMPVSDDVSFLKGKNWAINKTHGEQINKIDKVMMSIDKKLLILKYLTPLNLNEEREKFISSDGGYVPVFNYPEIRFDLDALYEKIKAIDITDIPLSQIYLDKKEEIINKIKLLNAFKINDSKEISYFSKKLYGSIDSYNLEYSNKILENRDQIREEEDFLSFSEIKGYINKFNHIYDIKINLKEGDRAARFVMKGNTLLIRRGALVGKKEMRSIIAHEIEGHYLRRENGSKMKYQIFKNGTASYLSIEEGIAIYNQNRFLNDTDRKYYSIYERYFFVNYALKNSYKKLIKKMREYYDGDLNKVFTFMSRLKRGVRKVSDDGIFVRDVVYVNGFMDVESFIESGGNLKELYLGKMGPKELEILKESYFIKLNFNEIKTPFFL